MAGQSDTRTNVLRDVGRVFVIEWCDEPSRAVGCAGEGPGEGRGSAEAGDADALDVGAREAANCGESPCKGVDAEASRMTKRGAFV